MVDMDLLVKDLIIALLPETELGAGRLEELIKGTLQDYSVTKIRETSLSVGDGAATKRLTELFIKDKLVQGLADGTIKQYFIAIQKIYEYCGKEVNLLTKDDITNYLNYYRYNGENKPNTVRNRYLQLSAFYSWLHSNHYIAENPILNVSMPRGNIPQKQIISVGEMEKIIIACENHQKGITKARSLALCTFLYETGVRVSELCNIQLKDVEWIIKRVAIRGGKGNKDRVVFFGEKSKERLIEYLNYRRDTSANDYLFTRLHYSQPMSKSGIERMVRDIGKLAEVDRLHPHLFRTTFATNLVSKGVSVSVVRALLGHSSLNALNSYVMLNETDILHSIEKVM